MKIDSGYRYIQQYWGKGYATEAAQAVLNFGIQQQLHNIVGCANVENIASVKILEKIGLEFLKYYMDEDGSRCAKYVCVY